MKGTVITHHPPLQPTLWTIVALLIAALPHLQAMPLILSATILLIMAWRAAAAWFQWRPIPGFVRVVITLLLIFLVVFAYGGMWGRRIATGLLCIMLAAKLMETYRVRDLRVVASVCFFLIAAQFLFNERLILLVYLIGGCWAATIALVKIQQIRTQGPRAMASSARSVLDPDIRSALVLLILAIPVALTLFVLFPRLAQPIWGLPDDVMDGRTGLSETMSPGSISELFMDDSPAFRVEFDGGPPPRHQLYWRGPVLWRFDGSTWRPAYFSTNTAQQLPPVNESSIRYRIQLEPHERRWLLGLDYPVQSSMPESRVTVDYQLVSRFPVTSLSQYDVISTPDFNEFQPLGAGQQLMGLNLPSDRNPRTQALAAELRSRYEDDRDLINHVLRWFREDEFSYSLSTSPLGRHSADEFLFDLRDGYCEYYASAFAILMRAAGIPSRVVTGYQGGFWSESGQYLLVRQSDAHAWNEVWLEGSGWTRVDPTAAVSPDRIAEGARGVMQSPRFMLDADWIRNIRDQYDRVQHLWNQWVLGFDASRQRNLLKHLGLPDLGATGIGLLLALALLIVAVPLTLWLLREHRQRGTSQAQKAWHHLLRQMRRQGLKKRPSETPLEFARRASLEQQQPDSELLGLALMFSRIHYGPDNESLTREFIEQVRHFKPQRN
jgi:protein-glutamine gamma-glutamyltransferase